MENQNTDKQAALYRALSLAQAEMRNAIKDAKNPHFKSNYATLGSVLDTVREPLTSNGLALTQLVQAQDGRNTLVTMLVHTDGGHLLSSTLLPEPVGSNVSQAFAAIVTYFRRVTAAAICGISQTDDDAESLEAPKPKQQPAPAPKPKQLLSPASVDRLKAVREGLQISTERMLQIMREAGYEYQFMSDADLPKALLAVEKAIMPPLVKDGDK